LDKFSFEARRTKRAKDYKVWQDSNHAVELSGYIGYEEKLDYIHNNPVKAGWVFEPQDFVYSSAIDKQLADFTEVIFEIPDIIRSK
jgi:putative transposase